MLIQFSIKIWSKQVLQVFFKQFKYKKLLSFLKYHFCTIDNSFITEYNSENKFKSISSFIIHIHLFSIIHVIKVKIVLGFACMFYIRVVFFLQRYNRMNKFTLYCLLQIVFLNKQYFLASYHTKDENVRFCAHIISSSTCIAHVLFCS